MDRTMYRGDTFIFDVSYARDGIPVDVTGWTVWMTAKVAISQPDNLAVVRLDNQLLGGVAIVSALQGKARVTVPPLATRGLADGPTKLLYDVQGMDGSGNISTMEVGTLTVLPDVTRAIA